MVRNGAQVLRSALVICVAWFCGCDSAEPLDVCASVPIRRGEVMGTGSVHLKTAGVEANASHVRVGPGVNAVVVKSCEPHEGKLSSVYLSWSRDPEVPLPAPLRLFNATLLNPRPINGFEGSWSSCDADDCTVENGDTHFYSWQGHGGARNEAGEITAWDTTQARIAAWATFDTELTTYCDESGNSSRGPCDEVCGAFDDPCRHDIGEHIEIDIDVTWTPPADAGVGDDDGGA